MSDDLVEQLDKLARRAETSKTYVQEFRMMRAEGVADIIYEAKFRIEELEAQIKKDALQYLSDTGQMGDAIDDLTRRHEHALRKIDVLEDQLAKAIESLLTDLNFHGIYKADELQDIFAELKGEKDA